MSNWKCWPDDSLNKSFADIEHPDRIVYPDLNDESPLLVASDYSGEHARQEFRTVSFLVTTYASVAAWEPQRLAVRNRHLPDGRRISFKDLNDALAINAFSGFLDAASQLNGVLVCVAVEKGFSLPKEGLPPRHHVWTPDTLNKLQEICVFGTVMIDGLRTLGQPVHWITDDDAIVSNEHTTHDAGNLMNGLLHRYPDEDFEVMLGIASKFDDGRRAEDLVAIPDLAAGAFSETLKAIGKANMPTTGTGPNGKPLWVHIKSGLINAWRSFNDKPLKHLNATIRPAEGGQMLVSFGSPFVRLLKPGESAEGAPTINSKWRRAFEADMKARGIDPEEVQKSMHHLDMP